MTSVYDMLRRACGLSQKTAADFHDARPDTVISWCSDRRPAPQGVIDELRDLYAEIQASGKALANQVSNDIQTDTGGSFYLIGMPADDDEAVACGFPSLSAAEAATAIAIAALPPAIPIRLTTRVPGVHTASLLERHIPSASAGFQSQVRSEPRRPARK